MTVMDPTATFHRHRIADHPAIVVAGRFLHADERVWTGPQGFPAHCHQDFEVIIPTVGEYRCRAGARSVAARPGQMVLIRPGTWHEDRCAGDVTYRTIAFTVAVSSGTPFAADAAVPVVWQDRAEWWPQAWRRFRELADRHQPWNRTLADNLVAEAIAWLCAEAPAGSLDPGLFQSMQRGDLARQLEEAFLAIGGRPAGLAGLARRMRLPARTLRARCVRELGAPPSRLWLAWRLQRAQDLLLHTQGTCAAIAASLGFATAAHFSRAFRQRYGTTPNALRSAAADKPSAAAGKARRAPAATLSGMEHLAEPYHLTPRLPTPAAISGDGQIILGDGLRMTLDLQAGLITAAGLSSAGVTWAAGPWLARLAVRDREGRYADTGRWRLVGDSGAPAPTAPAQRALELVPDWECSFRPELRLRLVCAWEGRHLDVALTLVSGHEAPLALDHAMLCWQRPSCDDLACFPIPFGEHDGVSRLLPLAEQDRRFALARDGAVLVQGVASLLLARQPRDLDQRIEVFRAGDGLGYGFLGRSLAEELAESWLAPGEERDLGAGRLLAGDGGLTPALRAHRAWMRQHGIGIPTPYQPPLSYCMYYEASGTHSLGGPLGTWPAGVSDLGRSVWGSAELQQGIATAADLGCELLYTDQGWETTFGSGVWDEVRLGPCADAVAAAQAHQLGLGVLVSLHGGEAAWGAGPAKKDRRGAARAGDPWHPAGVCPADPAWQAEKTRRLVRLVDAGIGFFSFDFHNYTATGYGPLRPDAECCDPSHGHPVPLPRWAHAHGVAAQQAAVRRARPQVLIESHDWLLAGSCIMPCYMHRDSCQELWGFEYMWAPLHDLLGGRLHNLYWYNLAYERPLYLHIDLRSDSPHLVVFWYMASVIRHLGVGGAAGLDDARRTAVRAAIAVWKQHRDWFTLGAFDGPEPCVHLHTLAGRGAVVLVFNDRETPVHRRLDLDPARLGVTGAAEVTPIIGDAAMVWNEESGLQAEIALPALGVAGWRIDPRS